MPVWKVCFQPRWVLTLSEGTKRYLKLRFQVEKFMAIIGFYIGWPFQTLIFLDVVVLNLLASLALSINQPTAIKNPAASSDVVITGYPVLKPAPRWYLFISTPTWGYFSNEQWKHPGFFRVYIADYITQLCWDYSKPLQGSPLTNQEFIWKEGVFSWFKWVGSTTNSPLVSPVPRLEDAQCRVPKCAFDGSRCKGGFGGWFSHWKLCDTSWIYIYHLGKGRLLFIRRCLRILMLF